MMKDRRVWIGPGQSFRMRAHNWAVRFERPFFEIKERIRLYFHHRRYPDASKNWVEYMKGVSECHERERKKEQLMTEEEREKYQRGKREAIEAIMLEAEKRRKNE